MPLCARCRARGAAPSAAVHLQRLRRRTCVSNSTCTMRWTLDGREMPPLAAGMVEEGRAGAVKLAACVAASTAVGVPGEGGAWAHLMRRGGVAHSGSAQHAPAGTRRAWRLLEKMLHPPPPLSAAMVTAGPGAGSTCRCLSRGERRHSKSCARARRKGSGLCNESRARVGRWEMRRAVDCAMPASFVAASGDQEAQSWKGMS